MNSLDANAVLRYLLDDLPTQSQRVRLVITTSPCYVSDVILTEVVFVLERVRRFHRADVAKLIRQLLKLGTVVSNRGLILKTLELYLRKKQLSFPDCYAAVEARLSGDTLLTFDKDLIKHGGSDIREP
jgi:predicted nucleic-acid-binding protein